MTMIAHMEVIQAKHGKLESVIAEELRRPSPDMVLLQMLKKQKLLLKEEIMRLQREHEVRPYEAA